MSVCVRTYGKRTYGKYVSTLMGSLRRRWINKVRYAVHADSMICPDVGTCDDVLFLHMFAQRHGLSLHGGVCMFSTSTFGRSLRMFMVFITYVKCIHVRSDAFDGTPRLHWPLRCGR